MRHVQFILLFLSAIGAHLLFSRYSTTDGWKRVNGSEIINTPNEQPVILYASVSPGIRQLKWHCLSGQLRIAKVEVKTTRGEKRSFTFSPSVLQAGLTTPPLDLSGVDGTVASVALWYDSVPSSQQDTEARVEMLSSSFAGRNP
jgi:hypothetical protein